MLEFSISNQLLSRLDATKVVADSENYLECAFQFSQDWENTVAVATFGHSQVKEPISVRIVDGKCVVPHEVIKTYGFQMSVYGTAEGDGGVMCHIPTNVVTVEVEASGTGSGMTPAEPSKSMYDSLMAAIAAGENAATQAKVSAQASAEMADGAQRSAKESEGIAKLAAENSAVSAGYSASEALLVRDIWDRMRAMARVIELADAVARSYVVGDGAGYQVCTLSDIPWKDGVYEMGTLDLGDGRNGRFQVRVDDTWYDVIAQWDLAEESKTVPNYEADLSSLKAGRYRDEGEIPEVPKGEEAIPVEPPETTGGETDPDETPEIPGGEEVNPGGGSEGGDTGNIPVVKPVLSQRTVRNVMILKAGPVTIEDIQVNWATGEKSLCRITTMDASVRELEVRVNDNDNAKYFYQQAMAAALRAEAAALRAEAARG